MQEIEYARRELEPHHPRLIIERYIRGKELTVGVLEGAGDGSAQTAASESTASPKAAEPAALALKALPPIHIVPAVAFYDHEAKYTREDTEYRFDIDEPAALLEHVQGLATRAFQVLGVRHLGRVDFIIDANHQPWILEVNTMPGFTSHSLLPMAANRVGLTLPELTDHLVRMATG